MSAKSTLDSDSFMNSYPDIVYTLEPIIQHSIRLLRILRWKEGYTHQSIILTLVWTLFWFHTLIVSYTIPIWILIVIYYNCIDQQPNMKETTVDSFEKLTVELKEIEFEISLILPSPELKDRFRQWCRSRSQFVLDHTLYYKSLLFISLYATWISMLKLFGGDKITWFLGCIFLTWNSPLFKVTRYSYHRASFMLKQYTQHINNNNNKGVSEAQAFAMSNMTSTTTSNYKQSNKQKNANDHFDRFYRFVVIEHQRWWLHCGWSSLLLPKERPEWSDEYLSKVPSIQSFHLPHPTTRVDKNTQRTLKISWEWVSQDWEIDRDHRPVDDKGWEYGSFDWKLWSTKSSGLRVLTRRRRWVRNARLVEEVIDMTDDQRSITTTTTASMAIPIIIKKTNTCSSLSTSLSSEDSFLCSTPTITTTPTLFQSKSSPTTSTTTFSLNHHSVEPSIFSDSHSTVDSQLWLRR